MKLITKIYLLLAFSLPIKLVAQITSAASGNWNLGTTWVGGVVPTTTDDVIIDVAHSVIANATATVKTLTVNGALDYASTAASLTITGNLVVNTGGALNVYSGTTGKAINVAGNFINNGNVDLSKTSSTLTLNATNSQSVYGSGNLVGGNINKLTFNATTIDWSLSNTVVAGTLTFTKGLVSLGAGNSMTLGTSVASVGTLTLPTITTGFTSGTFIKWMSSTTTGSAYAAGSNPAISPTDGRMPFMTTSGLCRHFMWNRTTTGTGGKIACTYSDAATFSTSDFYDGTYHIEKRSDCNWSISTDGTTPSAGTINILLYLTGASVYPANGNSRIVAYSSPLLGSQQNGQVAPHYTPRRVGLTNWTDVTGQALYVGISRDDLPFETTQSGDWNTSTTWLDGVVPTNAKNVLINNGHNVTISTAGNVCKTATIVAGGSLTQTSGDLFIGSVDYDNFLLLNGGTFDMQGGTVSINGRIQVNGVATNVFKQSGGNIIVDGNSGNVAIPSTTGQIVDMFCVNTSMIQFTGGTMTIVDPPTSATNTICAFKVYPSVAHSTGAGWTLKLGNGTSTDAGGHLNGFLINLTNTSSFNLANDVVVDIAVGTNRYVTTSGNIGIKNLTINNGEYRASSAHFINGNIVNNGTLTSTSTLTFSGFNGSSAVTGTTPQSIGGTGVFRNSTSSAAVNLVGLGINNTGGLTLNRPFNMSGTLSLTNGTITTSSSNLLTLESSSIASPAGGSATSYVNGPIAKKTTSTTAFIFPTGKNSTYRKVTVTPAAITAAIYTAEFFDTPYSNLTSLTSPIKAVHSKEYFDITGTNGGKVALTYDLPAGFASNIADLSVAHFTGGSWINEAATATTTGVGVVTTTAAVSTWSPFAVGSFDAVSSPLPISLKSLSAIESGSTNVITWETAIEQNVRQFVVEKSIDAKNWSSLGITTPNSNQRYSIVDEHPSTITYYHLRNIDNDGKENTSNTVVVNRKLGKFSIASLAPNPTTSDITVKVEMEKNSNTAISVLDILGKSVITQNIDLTKGINTFNINTNDIPTGTYYLNINNGEKILTTKFIKN